MLTTEELRVEYAKISDDTLRRIVYEEAHRIRPEIYGVLIDEINKPRLGEELVAQVEAVRRPRTPELMAGLKAKVKNCVCPHCRRRRNLRGYAYDTHVAALVVRVSTPYRIIVCEECGAKLQKQSLFKTLGLGWWSVAGILWTPFDLIGKARTYLTRVQVSEAVMDIFLEQNYLAISLGQDRQEEIQRLVNEWTDDALKNKTNKF